MDCDNDDSLDTELFPAASSKEFESESECSNSMDTCCASVDYTISAFEDIKVAVPDTISLCSNCR